MIRGLVSATYARTRDRTDADSPGADSPDATTEVGRASSVVTSTPGMGRQSDRCRAATLANG